MDGHASHYQILGVAASATDDEIRAAFRRQAQLHHPDHNPDSPAAADRFVLVSEAWRVLGDPASRSNYDGWLLASSAGASPGVNRRATPRPERPTASPGHDNRPVLERFNYLLWDIDDLLAPSHRPALRERPQLWPDSYLEKQLLTVLAFIDRWVLGPGGFPDHFESARRLDPSDPRELGGLLGAGLGGLGHRAYVDATDYFYDIRKRVDRFQNAWASRDLSVPVQDTSLRLIDCVLEAQNLAVHVLGKLMQGPIGQERGIPPYAWSHPDFLA